MQHEFDEFVRSHDSSWAPLVLLVPSARCYGFARVSRKAGLDVKTDFICRVPGVQSIGTRSAST